MLFSVCDVENDLHNIRNLSTATVVGRISYRQFVSNGHDIHYNDDHGRCVYG